MVVSVINMQHDIPLKRMDVVDAANTVPKDDPSSTRHIQVGFGMNPRFPTNAIRSSKYTLLTWAPKSLITQFSRVANIYFLIISILTAMPFSPKNPVSMIGTFSGVLIFTMLKEAYEDYFRHKQDNQVNSMTVYVLDRETYKFVAKKSQDLEVADIVKIHEGEQIPADMLFVSSQHPKGLAFVNTMNLDGETNLKEKLALESTNQMQYEDPLLRLQANIWCDVPSPNMYNWNCNVQINNSNLENVGFKQFLVRGSVLKNTEYAFGIVMYTGVDTKIVMNSKSPPRKISNILRIMNRILYTVFAFQLFICITFAGLNIQWSNDHISDHSYLEIEDEVEGSDFFIQILTFWVAYSHLIPISLYVALEIVKLAQAYLISQDLDMYYEPDDKPASARTSDLVEELGQVEFVFSDKTGTLTCNSMEFKKFTLGETVYEGFPDDLLRDTSHPQYGLAQDFFKELALCHSAFPVVEKDTGKVTYQASSPDEVALVNAASKAGTMFIERSESTILLKYRDGTLEEFEILVEIPFSSERRRMMIIVRNNQGIHLMVKGADSVMMELLDNSADQNAIESHLYMFAMDGLRTLIIASKVIDEEVFADWYTQYRASLLISSEDKEERIYRLADKLENDLQFAGITAIEDKLQDNVPGTINLLMRANIRLWVLTGDKQETAIEIGKSCNLITDSMKQIILSSDSPEKIRSRIEWFQLSYELEEKSFEELEQVKSKLVQPLGIIVDGKTLQWIISDESLRKAFFMVGFLAQACICCRVTPLQKLQVVSLAKEYGQWITLAIGDGANDVSMIQEAHIGVGIFGKEGTQAVQASDFALAQFSFLSKLLLVHGRWSYKRISRFICYYFYKNIVLVFTELYFSFFNGFSGQIFFLDWLPMLYNALWTSWPCLVAYTFEQDLDAKESMEYPIAYAAGQKRVYFSFGRFWAWVLFSVWHSLVCYWIPIYTYDAHSIDESGVNSGLWWVSSLAFTLVIHIVTYKLFVETFNWTWLNLVICSLSILFYYLSVILFNIEIISEVFQPEAIWLFFNLLGSFKAWIGILLLPVLAIIPDLFFVMSRFVFYPTPIHQLMRWIKKDK